jgi:hypothetical protein
VSHFIWLWAGLLCFVGAVTDLRYRIYRSKVDLLVGLKQVQLQILEIQDSLQKWSSERSVGRLSASSICLKVSDPLDPGGRIRPESPPIRREPSFAPETESETVCRQTTRCSQLHFESGATRSGAYMETEDDFADRIQRIKDGRPLDVMRVRTAIYTGERTLSAVYHFLHGFGFAQYVYQIPASFLPPDFHDWV